MSLKLIKNETELINFVEKYKNEFDFMLQFCIYNDYGENEIHKESLKNFFEFMYKHMRLERYFKDHVLMICEFENIKGIKKDSFIVECETTIVSKNEGGLSIVDSNPWKVKTTLYEKLNTIDWSLKLPEGLLDHENKSVNEKLFKEYIGIKHLPKGIEFDIKMKTKNNKEELNHKFKLLEYKKEFRPYFYEFILFFNKNDEYFTNKNNDGKEFYIKFDLSKNMMETFFNNFNEFYMIYLNYIYNNKFKNLENIFDYEKNQLEIINFMKKYVEEKSKLCLENYPNINERVVEFTKIINQLDSEKNKNFNKEWAHVVYLEKVIYSELQIVENFKDYYIDELGGIDFYDFTKIDFYKFLMVSHYNMSRRPLKESNIWIKGYGKFSDI